MPKNLGAPLTFYPAYCFPLSPTFNAWARLNAIDVHALQERPGFEGMALHLRQKKCFLTAYFALQALLSAK